MPRSSPLPDREAVTPNTVLARAEAEIAAYLAAFKAANGGVPSFRLQYVRGWVECRSRHSSHLIDRKRLSHLAEMTERLRCRANDAALAILAQEADRESA